MAKKYKEICEEQKEIIKVLENKLADNETFGEFLNRELSAISENVADLRTEIAAKDKLLETKTIDFNNLNDIKVKLEAELADVITVKDNLADKLANVIETNVKFKSEIKSLNNKLKLSDDQLVNEISTNFDLRRRVKAHDTMSIVFGLVAVLAILGCIIFG